MMNPVSEVTPQVAWQALKDDPASVLVDVRTMAEWSFVGVPDLSSVGKPLILVEWQHFPGWARNDAFVESLSEQLGGFAPSSIYFLCRSGARSLNAAQEVASAFAAKGQAVSCVNVQGGFEGDPDSEKHRGNKNGWKQGGLPWHQS